MARDSGPVEPLEERCERPGRWVIEGRDVRKLPAAAPGRRWQIIGPHPRVARRTLGEIRDWIRDNP